MDKAWTWARNGLAVVGLLAIGYCAGQNWAGHGGVVRAASYDGGNVGFQLAGVNEASSLLVYQPSSRTVYVYRGATVGNSRLNCSYKYLLGTPGGAIDRVNCEAGSASR